ncbi:hypothetical protein ULG90_25410 [Halopseudomonas pachastrellae]|nr:hypothetical protein ULG90_25410 [Halopseudomonas pachastrellae]
MSTDINTDRQPRSVFVPAAEGGWTAPAGAILLFASFSSAPEFEPARPIVQATLVQLDSMSPSTTPTDQKIAGEAQQSRSPRADEEALEKQREQQQAAEAARAAQAEQARQ